jgi:diguanylate cyclase (GGDEF)-like protein
MSCSNHRSKLLSFVFVYCAVFSFSIFAEETISIKPEIINFDIRSATMHFTAVTGHKGLDLTNSSITEDDLGYLWVGTQDGLVRLDGYQSQRFIAASKAKDGLVSNNVSSLAFDKQTKKLWIGTANGLSVYNTIKEKFTSYKHQKRNLGSISNNVIKVVYRDAKGRIWLGTQDGLNLYEPTTDTFTRFYHSQGDTSTLTHSHIMDIKEDRAGNLWVATQSGLNLFQENNVFKRFYPFTNDDGSFGLITKIAIDNKETLWLGTEQNGLLKLNPKTGKSNFVKAGPNGTFLTSKYIRALHFDSEGSLWVGTNAGLSIYSPLDKNFLNITNNTRLNGNVVAIYEDSHDVMWIGTWAKGLHSYNPQETQVGKLDLRILKSEGDTLKSIIIDNKNMIWYANPKNLFKMDTKLGVIEKYSLAAINPTENRAAPFYNKKTNRLYLLTDKIYDVTDMSAIRSHELPKEMNNISWYGATMDSLDRVWIGSRSVGIFILSSDFKKILKHKEAAMAGYIREVTPTTMLVGSYTATYWVNIHTMEEEIHTPDTIDGMLHPNVTGYIKTSAGEEWMATSGGIHQLISNEQGQPYYKTWTQEDGLPTDVLTGPIEDSTGRLWFSSTDGLIRFDPKSYAIEHYDVTLGAFSNYYIGQYLKNDEQRMFFVGPKGVSIIDERHVKNNQTAYPVIINELELKGQVQSIRNANQNPASQNSNVANILEDAIEYTNQIRLPADNRDFTFSFSTTYMTRTDTVKYYYRLIGFDESWLETDSTRRQLKYTNLNPGHYLFEIYSMSSNGVKGDVTAIDVNIDAFYYESSWFKFLIGLLSLSIFFVWYKYRMYKIQQFNKELQLEVDQRTQNIRTLADIGRDISSILDIHELLEHLYSHLNKSLDASVLAIGVYEPENNRITFERSLENGKTMPFHERPMDSKKDLAAWCIENNKEVVLNRNEELYQYIEQTEGPVVGESMQSVVYIPIRSRSDKMLGCMTLQTKKIEAYGEEDLEFIRTIANYTGIAMDNALAHNELKKVSSTDFLTNLPNRRAFIEQLESQIKIVKRTKQPLSIAMGDIDHFKQFNDVHGHECGDYVLQQVAKIYRKNIREQDIVARWGGEEFIFLFFNTPAAGAKIALNKIRVKLEQTELNYQDKVIQVSSTFGAAVFELHQDFEDTINNADAALYEGKEDGRNCVKIFEFNDDAVHK